MKSRGISVKNLLNYIPQEVLACLSIETQVDRQVKKLQGKVVFQLLLYSLLNTNRLSLNVAVQYYQSTLFKRYTGLEQSVYELKRNTLSDRLSMMNLSFFKAIYAHTVQLFEKHFDSFSQKQAICRVDSTTVSCSSKLLSMGMYNGVKPKDESARLRQLKFTIGFNGLLVREAKLYTQQSSEDKSLAETIFALNQKKDEIVVFDRGLKKRKSFRAFSEQGRLFVTRINPNSFYQSLSPCSEVIEEKMERLAFCTDQVVYLKSNGNVMKFPFRLIQAENIENAEPLWFLTNIWSFSAKEITDIYKKRWDIEVFFRFLKQELCFSHLLNRSQNGIMIMLYMTLIAAMMILIYRQLNELKGYKIVKMKFAEELQNEIIKDIVLACGGKPELLNNFFP